MLITECKNEFESDVDFKAAVQHNTRSHRKGKTPQGLCIHYAVARNLDWLVNYFAGPVWTNDRRWASSHFCIGSDGKIIQMVEIEKTAFTVGDGRKHNSRAGLNYENMHGGWWIDTGNNGNYTNLVNETTINIEMCIYPQDTVTDELYRSISDIYHWLCRNYSTFSWWNIAGHEHYACNRKVDPGVKFDWKKLLVDFMGISLNQYKEYFSYLDDTKHLTTNNITKRQLSLEGIKKLYNKFGV